jgi:hypothetical protein
MDKKITANLASAANFCFNSFVLFLFVPVCVVCGYLSRFQNPRGFPPALEFLSLKSLCNKDLRLAKHPTFKEAGQAKLVSPKTKVLGQLHLSSDFRNNRGWEW